MVFGRQNARGVVDPAILLWKAMVSSALLYLISRYAIGSRTILDWAVVRV